MHFCNLSIQNICYVILFQTNAEINYFCLKNKSLFFELFGKKNYLHSHFFNYFYH
jgi:hypothetical protein